MNTEENYSIGVNAGLEALEKIHKTLGDDNHSDLKDALAGIMTTVMHCAYAAAPTEEIAEELISTAQQFALKDWEKEK
tara:strand:- start:1437 stop:1670 length:234 start_codon:yes stop_codon:yes gene_type:complete